MEPSDSVMTNCAASIRVLWHTPSAAAVSALNNDTFVAVGMVAPVRTRLEGRAAAEAGANPSAFGDQPSRAVRCAVNFGGVQAAIAATAG
jgi:hypothetical protein